MRVYSIHLVVFFALLNFCGCKRESGKANTSGTNQQNSRPVAQQRIKLVVSPGGVFSDTTALRTLLAEFSASHTNIDVTVDGNGGSGAELRRYYAAKLPTYPAPFDIYAIDSTWIGDFIGSGWLKSLGAASTEASGPGLFRGAVAAGQFENRLYAVPWFLDVGVLYYRKDLLAGANPPVTWGEITAAALELKRRQPTSDILTMRWPGDRDGLVDFLVEMLWSNGGQIFQRTKVMADSRQNQIALNFAQSLIHRYQAVPPFPSNQTARADLEAFKAGKSLFLREWASARTQFAQDPALASKVGWASLPYFSGQHASPMLRGSFLGVNSRSRHAEEAALLVDFLTSEWAMKTLTLQSGLNPARKSVYRDADVALHWPGVVELEQSLDRAQALAVSPHREAILEALHTAFRAALTRETTPEEALEQLQGKLKTILAAPAHPTTAGI